MGEERAGVMKSGIGRRRARSTLAGLCGGAPNMPVMTLRRWGGGTLCQLGACNICFGESKEPCKVMGPVSITKVLSVCFNRFTISQEY